MRSDSDHLVHKKVINPTEGFLKYSNYVPDFVFVFYCYFKCYSKKYLVELMLSASINLSVNLEYIKKCTYLSKLTSGILHI